MLDRTDGVGAIDIFEYIVSGFTNLSFWMGAIQIIFLPFAPVLT